MEYTTTASSVAPRDLAPAIRHDADALTERSLRIWGAGDYDRIAAGFRHEADAFVARRSLRTGDVVLDAACGSGNLTIPAARTGATVTGLDLVPALLADAARWARGERLTIALDQGNAEALPYADGRFDVVMSMFGVMFAARPERVAAELARVTRRGGRLALANWTRTGFTGRMLAMHAAVVPPPAGVPSPLLWGDETHVRALLGEDQWEIATTLRTLTFRFPHVPAETAALFGATYGPTVRTLEALEPARRAPFMADLTAHWSQHQRATGATTEVDAEYLEVVAVRR
ncbi:class I SAM-dependent methyltransferase [Roseisolibacter agri]|uniref:Methyltransferase n=1 Tax=Roseisolibacter agri TaxID=2014610 RepID=A0AA37QAX8_9BACT|nr:class I SAM-dependent methyltransferase [Roseisolibacter agri]GLC26957.1 methyltransferase [Roseisolibacter agri]